MTSEIEAFRAELRAAGEPWQQRGVKVVLAGFVILVAANLSGHFVDRLTGVLAVYGIALAVLAVGWGMLVVAFLRRRRWAKTYANLVLPDLPDAP